jgi:zinc transporter, ZIP family
MLELILAATGTALATGLGAIPVFPLGTRAVSLKPALLGFAAGAMAVASVAGLILPGLDEGNALEVGIGTTAGIVFLTAARILLGRRKLDSRTSVARATSIRTSVLVFTVLLVHSLPEGFAIGTAYASETGGLALFVIVAIAVQNIPEGTSVAIPMAAAGYSPVRQFWAAVLTSVPQPIGAIVAFLLVEEVTALLPVSFGFAGGAMLTLVVVELVPESLKGGLRPTALGAALGAGGMLLLSSLLGV